MKHPFRRWGVAAGMAAALILAGALNSAEAQYFGRNKVQYEKFDFKVLATPHFDIYYYPEELKAATETGRMAERWYARYSRMLNHELNGRQPIILYASHPDFEQTNAVEGTLGEGTGGVTEGAKRRVVLPMAATLADSDHVLGHELLHAFQYDILGPNIEGLPLWFIEGMAEYLSIGPRDPQTAMWIRDAAIEGRLPTIKKLDDPRYFPYRFGHAFWAYIAGRYGDEAVGQILVAMAPTSDAAGRPSIGEAMSIIEQATGKTEDEISAEWHASIYQTYGLQPSPTPKTKPTDTLIIGARTGSGSMNVGPALSPDGSLISFLSTREQLSIDLYLAETASGRIVKKLVSTAADSHFESLQFLASAGAWDAAGQHLAIGTIRKGKPVLAIIDVKSGDITKEYPLPDLGEIFQPTWSPDGKSIAISAQVAGFTDLYVVDLASGLAKRLTNDPYADLQPAWSPDGSQIAFVTDRFSADMETLAFHGDGLATISVADGTIKAVDTGLVGNSTNPQWSGDKTLFFLADSDGRSNMYRLDLASGQSTQVTNEVTGVSGITPLSPAMSVAMKAERAAVTIFRDGAYEIQFVDTVPGPPPPLTDALRVLAGKDAAVLPPSPRVASTITRMLGQPATGLPPASANFAQQPYKKGLQLVGIGTSAAVGMSGGFGTYFGGGIAFQFSDMLGNHLLGTGIAINGGVSDIGAGVNYLNRVHRMNWGLYADRAPITTGSFGQGVTTINGQTVLVDQTLIFRQTFTEGGAMLAYPLSRTMRVEATGGIRHISFTNEVDTNYYDRFGNFITNDHQKVEAAPSLDLLDVGTAVIRDTSAFGATSPVLGQRLRFEVSPTFGDLHITTITADVRQYVMPFKPVTFAGRFLHVGRYGTSAEDERLMPFFLGYSTLIRGYDMNSFTSAECSFTLDGSCPEFDRLIGSRMIVTNGEVRAPIPGLFHGKLDYGPVPVEIMGFYDGGVAWNQFERPAFVRNGTRDWVSSVGAGARVNAMGFAILEFNLVKPLNRPLQSWMFVFNLRAGF